MIAYIRGIVADLAENYLVLDNNGMGYRIFVPGRVLDTVGIGEEVRIYTHMGVREDALTLYGFTDKDDLGVFRLILNVSGIGPKTALAVLSTMSASELRFAVLSDDIKSISKVPGLGRKTAQKMILELKDKFDLNEALETGLGGGNAAAVSADNSSVRSDAVMALTALGYGGTEAMRAVQAVLAAEPELTVEEVLKKALKKM
ncbi:MAG: Holliday junction branch migration protein RuvA [Lachnospiraceae bacterium]|nr:Holliday junction branch migration protein RuvA [Lachnospiraceae bacterium]